jgi:mannose-6-phosphate isomerase class I
MHKLNCGIQKYGWGRKGVESSAAVYKKAQDEAFVIDPTQAYAELWMGKKNTIFIMIEKICLKQLQIHRNPRELSIKYSNCKHWRDTTIERVFEAQRHNITG